MKLLISFVVVLSLCARGAETPRSSGRLISSLRDACSTAWPEGRVEVEQLSTREAAPDSAAIININPRMPIGSINFELVWEDKGVAHRTTGNAIVKVFRPVAVAKKILTNGEAFTEENTSFEEREITRFTQTGFHTNWEELRGKVARGYIRPDSLIGIQNSEKPVEILQGQMVDLRHVSSQMTISARMKALENGRFGNWIRVENPTSKKVVRARVTAPGQVELS